MTTDEDSNTENLTPKQKAARTRAAKKAAKESPPAPFDGTKPADVVHDVPEDDSEPDLDEVESMLPEGAKQLAGKPEDLGPEIASNGKPLIAQTQIQLSREGTMQRKLLKPGDEVPKGWMAPDKIAEFIRSKPQIISTKKVIMEGPSILG